MDCYDLGEAIGCPSFYKYEQDTGECPDDSNCWNCWNREMPVLNERLSNEVFGEMRCLTPEENARKLEMYRSMSTQLEQVIRCRDCALWHKDENGLCEHWSFLEDHRYKYTQPDDFCSYGFPEGGESE